MSHLVINKDGNLIAKDNDGKHIHDRLNLIKLLQMKVDF